MENNAQTTMERLRTDIILLLYNEPFFAYLLSKTKKVISEKVAVAGVAVIEGTVVLYINPKGYLSYTTEERLFILIHEVMHIIFNHHNRKEKRNHGMWNVATDLAINQLIESNYAHMPKDCLRIDSWEQKHGFRLPEKRDAEEYYRILLEEKEKIEVPDHMKDGPQGQHLDSPENMDDVSAPSPAGGNSNATGQPFDKLHPSWEESTEVSEELSESMVRALVQQAYSEARGNVSFKMHALISERLQANIPWKHILYNFIAKRRATNKKSTWKKRNRRLGNAVMGYKKSRKLVVAVAFDTSASITEDDFKRFFAEVVNIQQNGATVILLECDAKVHTVTAFKKHYQPQFIGRGGTDFRPVFRAIEKKEHKLLIEKPSALIFFTDGEGPAPDVPTIPTLWCLTKEGKKPWNSKNEEIGWGSFLKIEQ